LNPRLLITVAFTMVLLQCTPHPPEALLEDPASLYLARYHTGHSSLTAASWEGHIGVVTREIDQLVLPYQLEYRSHSLYLTLFSPFGTTMGEIEITDDGTRIESMLPGLFDLESTLAEINADSLEISPADAYSYFWGIPFVANCQDDPDINISFDNDNLPRSITMDSQGSRELQYRFRELTDGTVWPKSIRFLDPGELQVTITMKEPHYED
jgi:hypothetical protein